MKVTYDKAVDAAYIYLDSDTKKSVAKTEPVNPDINLDFDAEGKLLGIEVLSASKNLPHNLLQDSEKI